MTSRLPLPRTDTEGNSYVSYSQLSMFKRDPGDYYLNYILGLPKKHNPYTDFGSKVGEALETNDFSKFDPVEQETLSQVVRLDEFEREVRLQYDGFYVLGYIDTNRSDLSHIIDYKTGGEGKESQYQKEGYTQLCLYALALRQETGVTPSKAQVNFIRREGNPGSGEALTVGSEAPLLLDIDISEDRLKQVYWDTLRTTQKMSEFYLKYKGDKK